MAKTRRLHSGPGRPPGDSTSRTRKSLIDAGLEVFADVGYDAASTRRILACAGVTAPALYHHFDNKAGLYEAVAEHVNDILVFELSEAAAIKADLGSRLRAAFSRAADLQERNRALVRLLMTAPIELRRHAELKTAAQQMNRVLELFDRICHEHDEDPHVDAEGAARACRVLLFGLARMAATTQPADYRRTSEAVLQVLDGPPFRIA